MKAKILIIMAIVLALVPGVIAQVYQGDANTSASVTNEPPSIGSVRLFRHYVNETNNVPSSNFSYDKNATIHIVANLSDWNGGQDIDNVSFRIAYLINDTILDTFPRFGTTYQTLYLHHYEGLLNAVYEGNFTMTDEDLRRIGKGKLYTVIVSAHDGEYNVSTNRINSSTFANFAFNSSVQAIDFYTINLTANTTYRVNGSTSALYLDLQTITNLSDVNVTLIWFELNPTNGSIANRRGAYYVNIRVSDAIKSNLRWAFLNLTYRPSWLANADIDPESSLLWYHFNETIYSWQSIQTWLNTSVDNIVGNATHFSSFAIWGNKDTSSGGTILGRGGGGGGGGGGSYVRTITPTSGGTSVSMGQNEPFRISVNGRQENIKVYRVYKSAAQLLFKNLLYTLDKDQKVFLDVDGDGTDDLSAELTSTLFSRAFFTFKLISGSSAGSSSTPVVAPVTKPGTTSGDDPSEESTEDGSNDVANSADAKDDSTTPKVEPAPKEEETATKKTLSPGSSITLTLVILLLLIGGVYLILNWDSLFGKK